MKTTNLTQQLLRDAKEALARAEITAAAEGDGWRALRREKTIVDGAHQVRMVLDEFPDRGSASFELHFENLGCIEGSLAKLPPEHRVRFVEAVAASVMAAVLGYQATREVDGCPF